MGDAIERTYQRECSRRLAYPCLERAVRIEPAQVALDKTVGKHITHKRGVVLVKHIALFRRHCVACFPARHSRALVDAAACREAACREAGSNGERNVSVAVASWRDRLGGGWRSRIVQAARCLPSFRSCSLLESVDSKSVNRRLPLKCAIFGTANVF